MCIMWQGQFLFYSVYFCILSPTPQTLYEKSSFIPRTCKLWNIVPSSCFPESYNSFVSNQTSADSILPLYLFNLFLSSTVVGFCGEAHKKCYLPVSSYHSTKFAMQDVACMMHFTRFSVALNSSTVAYIQ